MATLNIALDVWKINEGEPRGTVNLRRLFAQACLLLSKEGEINLCFTGASDDRTWLQDHGYLNYGSFQNFRIPGKLQKYFSALKLLPWGTNVGNSDIYHSFSKYPYSSGRTEIIGTLIDFVPIRLPDYVPLNFVLDQIRWCKWASRHPFAKWISISNHTKEDAISLSCIHEDQVWVTDLCADTDMFKKPTDIEINQILKKYHLQRPYLLFVSTLNPRKNHLRVLDAWTQGCFAEAGWELVLVGHNPDNPITGKLEAGDYTGVNWVGYVPKSELICLYYGCEGFVYLSLYEGFGLPVADAIVAGKAVLTSRNSPMADFAGTGAICVDPWNVDEISKGFSEVIHNSVLRNQLAKENLINREYLSIQRLADDLYEVYKSIQHISKLK